MKKKQWIALLLALALVAALPTAALAAPRGAIAPAFTDISDPRVAESADLLRLLGIVNGTGGTSFRPQGTLTRAEFCKMAVELLGEGGKAASQMNRTIFRDVPSTHWARGYIHVAAQATTGENGSAPLIRGDGAGYFHPNDPITFAEAVTILMRVLGYSDDTVGFSATWYDGYLSTAAQIGLTDSVSAAPQSSITRGDAAVLFANLLDAQPRNSKDSFLVARLGGSVTDSQLVLEVKGKETSGGWTLRTAEKSYRTRRDNLSTVYQGRRCKLVLDADGDVLALQADTDYTTRTLRILSAEARYVMAQGQEQIIVDPATPVFLGGQKQSTYGETYAKEMPYGTNTVFCYDKAGSLQSIYLLTGDTGAITAVATPGTDPFRPLFSTVTPTVYKNGVPASLSDIQPYDVGSFDGNADILNLSDRKLTGFYENAQPSAVSPTTITVLGADFNVLDCALKDLVNFKLGDQVTLLLDGSNNVAGVVSPDVVSAQPLGVATITGSNEAGYQATVELAMGVTISGKVSSSVTAMERAPGRLVSVSSSELGSLRLTTVTDTAAPGAWNVANGTLGKLHVSPQAVVYDKVGNSSLTKVRLSQVTAPTVSADKITYYHTDNSGNVDILLLDDATGECYTYGLLSEGDAIYSGGMGLSTSNPTIHVQNNGDDLHLVSSLSAAGGKGSFVGVVGSTSKIDGINRFGSAITLRSQKGVRRTSFSEDTVTVNGVAYPLAANIDDCCYNAKSKTWFSSLDAALAYTNTLTVYFDRSPAQGGKVRLVVAE